MSAFERQFKSNNIHAQTIAEIQQRLIKWGRKNYADFPWRKTSNPFHALIAETMLQRTKAEQVLSIYQAFIKRYPKIRDAAKENPDRIRRMLEPLGLRWRTEKILELIEELASRNERIPETENELIKLPGIGLYIASAFLSMHKGVKAPIIDRNAVRLWSRIFGFSTDSETHRKRWFIEIADRMTPQDRFKRFNYAVLDFARRICKPKPVCSKCPLTSYCKYFLQER